MLFASPVMSDSADCICGYFWSWTRFEDKHGHLGNHYFYNKSVIFILPVVASLAILVFQL